MDPHVDRSPGLGLPQPSIEQGAAVVGAYPSPEAAPGFPEAAQQPQPVPTAATMPVMMPPVQPMAIQPTVAMPQPAAAMSTVASEDDEDALDEEWVQKAKAIVERTKTDPYIESRELSKAKADYLRIRYNKQIKIDGQ